MQSGLEWIIMQCLCTSFEDLDGKQDLKYARCFLLKSSSSYMSSTVSKMPGAQAYSENMSHRGTGTQFGGESWICTFGRQQDQNLTPVI
ncbi:hypothetical protein CapIbe_014290 [Capra ibex]